MRWQKKEIQIRGVYRGGVAEGYQAEPIEMTPDIVTITGPKEEIDRVSYALVTVFKRKDIENCRRQPATNPRGRKGAGVADWQK